MKNFFVGLVAVASVLVGAVSGGAQERREGAAQAAELPTMPMGELQGIVREVATRISPAVVGLQMSNGSSGSGVMVSEEGLIMTAAHVTHPPGEKVKTLVLFPDGRTADVERLGAFYAQDAAFAEVAGEKNAKWPFVQCAKENPKVGEWVIALGHTAGFDIERTPPVRVGQVLAVPHGTEPGYIVTDCSMSGGDSGGPLFNLKGELIGIHSSIGRSLKQNLHVPIKIYHTHWTRMVSGEEWGGASSGAVLGVQIAPKGDDKRPGAVVAQIFPNSAAERAGLMPGDRILKVAGKDVPDGDALIELLKGVKDGDKVEFEVERPKAAEQNPEAEVDPDVEPEMETLKLEVEFGAGKEKEEEDTSVEGDGAGVCGEGTVEIQFDPGKLRRPGDRPDRSAAEVGIFTRPAANGLGVSEVVNGAPAQAAGVRRGDLIVKLDGVPVTSSAALMERFAAAKPGDKITLSVRRGGKDVDLEINLPKPDRPEAGEGPKRWDKDPAALQDLLARMKEGKVDPEEVRRMFQGRNSDLEVAAGYKPAEPRGKGPTLDQFLPLASSVRGSVVEMIGGYKSVGLGTAVGKSMVLAKASELEGKDKENDKDKLRVEMPSGVWADAKIVKTYKEWDLALVKVESTEELVPTRFSEGDQLASVGTMVTVFDNALEGLGYGVVGVASRSMAPRVRGFLGVKVNKAEKEGGVTVDEVVKDSAAEKSGLKKGDVIRMANGEEVKEPMQFTKLVGSCKPGAEVLFEILRGTEQKSVVAKLGERREEENTAPPESNTSLMGTQLSGHRYGYPSAMQHDVPLTLNQIGGPLVSFDGNVIGINIARAGRTKTFAIPSGAILKLLEGETLE